MVGSEFRENLSVEGKARLLKLGNKGAIGLVTIVTDGSVQPDNPKLAEVSLLVAAVRESIATCAHKCLVSIALFLGADTTITLRSLEDILAALLRHHSTFDACHT